MFGKKASKEESVADETSPSNGQSSPIDESAPTSESVEESDEAVDNDSNNHDNETPQDSKPQKSSWWSIVSNPNVLSFLNTAAQEVMALDLDQAKKLNKDQLMKAVSDKAPDSAQKEQLMKTIKNKSLDGEQKQQLMKTLNDKGPDIPEKEQLVQALAAQQSANGLLSKALSLKDTAMKCMNPQQRQQMMQEAYDNEIKANGKSRWASRLTSGPWQGGMGGAGIGGGVGMGLGTVVGTLVGGVAALPTTALGGLVGASVGGIHGPFVKLNHQKAQEVAKREKAKGKSDEEIAEAVKAEAGEEVVDEAMGSVGDAGSQAASVSQTAPSSAKRNSVSQQSNGKASPTSAGPPKRDPNVPRKKPKKLEVRSGGKKTGAKPGGKENDASAAS